MRARAWAVATATVLGLAALAGDPSPARASAGDWAFGVHGFGAALRRESMQWGGGAGLHASLGLSEAWSLVAVASWEFLAPRTDELGNPIAAVHLAGGGVGVAFAIDVLRVVPSLVGAVGAWAAVSSGSVRVVPGAELGLVFDYAIDRRWSLGVDLFRARLLWLDARLTPVFEVGARVGYSVFD